MNKKITKFSEMSFVLGMIILPLGAAMMAKADLGISMVVAPAYLLSLKFDALTFGSAEFILQTFLLAVMCIITRKIKFGYIMSFVTAIVYGIILDLWVALLALTGDIGMGTRIVFYLLGMVVSSLGVSFFFHTYLPPCAYDYFVRDISAFFNISITKFKLSYDISSLIVSTLMSLVFFSGIRGVGIGTLICACINGFIISFCSKFLEKYIDFSERFNLKKYFN